MKTCLLIQNIRVAAANAIPSPLTAGYTSLTAYAGFANAVRIAIAKFLDIPQTDFGRFAIVHHDAESKWCGHLKNRTTNKKGSHDSYGDP
ncbi:MAG: hypothetical protein ING19_21640, partial [Azospirillum sp.]|nr:hypothetical protein [Azospirillum sp.]